MQTKFKYSNLIQIQIQKFKFKNISEISEIQNLNSNSNFKLASNSELLK